jgi:hypothetical protein
MLVLNQPLEGPDLMRVQYLVGRPGAVLPGGPPAYDPAAPKPERGLVRLRVRDDLDALQEEDLQRIFSEGASLGDLIATDQVVPAPTPTRRSRSATSPRRSARAATRTTAAGG